MACLAGLGGGWCRVLGRERCHWQCESRLKALPPPPARAERGSSLRRRARVLVPHAIARAICHMGNFEGATRAAS